MTIGNSVPALFAHAASKLNAIAKNRIRISTTFLKVISLRGRQPCV